MTFKESVLKLKDYAGAITAIAGAVGILYGVHTWVENKNTKIESSLSRTEVEAIMQPLFRMTDSLSEQNRSIMEQQSIMINLMNGTNKNIVVLKDEFVRHIKGSVMPEEQKIDDILRIVQGISADMTDTGGYKIRAAK